MILYKLVQYWTTRKVLIASGCDLVWWAEPCLDHRWHQTHQVEEVQVLPFCPFLLCSRFRVHFVLFFLAFAMLIRSRTFFVEDLLKITARQVQAQGHGGLGEGFTGIAGRAVKVQTKLWIKEPRLISLATCNIMSFLVLWQILYQEQSTSITIPSDLFDIVVQDDCTLISLTPGWLWLTEFSRWMAMCALCRR